MGESYGQDRLERIAVADRVALARDRVVGLRNVLRTREVKHLRDAVVRQMVRPRTSKTGYDLEELAKQVWDPDRPIDMRSAERPLGGESGDWLTFV